MRTCLFLLLRFSAFRTRTVCAASSAAVIVAALSFRSSALSRRLTRLLGLSLLLWSRLVGSRLLSFRSVLLLLLRLSLRARLVLPRLLALQRGCFLSGCCSVRAGLSLPFAASAAPSALVFGVTLLCGCAFGSGFCCRLRFAFLSRLLLLHGSRRLCALLRLRFLIRGLRLRGQRFTGLGEQRIVKLSHIDAAVWHG